MNKKYIIFIILILLISLFLIKYNENMLDMTHLYINVPCTSNEMCESGICKDGICKDDNM